MQSGNIRGILGVRKSRKDEIHIQHKDKSQQELLGKLGSRLKIVHAYSNYGIRDSHLPPPAIGSVDWEDAQKIGYTGFFSLECGCGGNDKMVEANCEYCGKSTDAILEELL